MAHIRKAGEAMTDRPILFSALLVRALLEGRKTQTRRVLNLSKRPGAKHPGYDPRADEYLRLPYAPGDRLWCRERVQAVGDDDDGMGVRYLADDTVVVLPQTDEAIERHFVLRCYRSTDPDTDAYKPVPSIHMPRWASRIWLEVTEVRVQRLQEISEADARHEGVEYRCPGCGYTLQDAAFHMDHKLCEERGWPRMPNPCDLFGSLWNSIHGAGAWEANPWVEAISYIPHLGNIDAVKEAA